MNLILLTEGTGRGTTESSNVSRLANMLSLNDQEVLLQAGSGTLHGRHVGGFLFGLDASEILRREKKFFRTHYVAGSHVFLFGFSRGALIARALAQWLEKEQVEVEYMGLWDTVDATAGLDVPLKLSSNVKKARHALARDEQRTFFSYVPLEGAQQMVFPGCHSDVGGVYEDHHRLADLTLSWIVSPARRRGLRLLPQAHLVRKIAPSEVVLHDSLLEPSNMWGLLSPAPRTFEAIPFHPICSQIHPKEPQ